MRTCEGCECDRRGSKGGKGLLANRGCSAFLRSGKTHSIVQTECQLRQVSLCMICQDEKIMLGRRTQRLCQWNLAYLHQRAVCMRSITRLSEPISRLWTAEPISDDCIGDGVMQDQPLAGGDRGAE